MDLFPINRGHVLIVPNEHHQRFSSVNEDAVAEIFTVSQKVLKAIELSEIHCAGANLFLSDGETAGQEVPHAHLHIVPRFIGDGHRMGFSEVDTKKLNRERLDETAIIISKLIK